MAEKIKIPQYDPQKRYVWEANSVFQVSGPEFGILLNTLRNLVNTPEVQKAMRTVEALNAMEKAMARAVEMGVAKEDTKEEVKEEALED